MAEETTTIALTFKFHCPPARIHEALTDVRDVMRYTQAPAKIEPKVGGLYSIYDGAITGEFIRVDHEHIEMKWRMKNWSPACFSTVTIKNTPRGSSGTLVELTQTGIPLTDAYGNRDQERQVELGWRERVFHAMAKWVGLPLDKDDE